LEYKYPIIITDTSGSSRTYLPVVLGFGGQNLVNANRISSNGTNTEMQNGGVSAEYMMSTTNVTGVVSLLPSGGKVQLDLYTGYSPLKTSFPIVTGDNGYVTVPDNISLEPFASASYSFDGIYLPTSENTTIFSKPNQISASTGSGNVTVATLDNNALDYERTNSDYVTVADSDNFSFTDGAGNDMPFSIEG
jgi:hypothetical protein